MIFLYILPFLIFLSSPTTGSAEDGRKYNEDECLKDECCPHGMHIGWGMGTKLKCTDCDWEHLYDYYGHDIPGSEGFIYANNTSECAAACARNDECNFWTYYPSTSIKQCRLKYASSGRRYDNGRISGNKACGKDAIRLYYEDSPYTPTSSPTKVEEQEEPVITVEEVQSDCPDGMTRADREDPECSECVREVQIDYNGDNIPGSEGFAYADNHYECAAACARNDKCNFWTHYNHYCYMKYANSGRRVDNNRHGVTSGNKACGEDAIRLYYEGSPWH